MALQPVPMPPPELMADPRLAVTVCVSGMVSAAEVGSIAAGAELLVMAFQIMVLILVVGPPTQ